MSGVGRGRLVIDMGSELLAHYRRATAERAAAPAKAAMAAWALETPAAPFLPSLLLLDELLEEPPDEPELD